jgi:ABC-type branched-subunit amino acid transport system substrate-binding protein
MRNGMRSRARLVAVTAALALVVASLGATLTAGATPSVRGFDGTTVKVAGLGIASQLPTAETGSRARVKRFNDTNEIKGIKLDYVEFADDKQDVATALNEARRLVTQQQVFAIVGDISQFNPVDYLAQQHVPYFGWAFDDTYCSPKPSTKLWGFGFSGCGVPSDPSFLGDSARAIYAYASKQTGKAHPTAVLVGNDTTSSKNAGKFSTITWTGAGFKVVANQTSMPIPPITDYTPYAQAALTGDNGKAPDVIACLLATDCIPMYGLIKASGYKGIFMSSLYSNVLVGAMNGSTVNTAFVNPLESTPGMDQMKQDLDAFKAGEGAKVDSGTIAGYTSTDMFIEALKTIAKKGKGNITPENLQKAAAVQTWEIKGLAGPTSYPKATVNSYPACNSLYLSDGTSWNTVVPYACSTKTYKVPKGT